MSNRTPWFDGSVKPARDGWYERKYHRCGKVYPRMDLYAGGVWYIISQNNRLYEAMAQHLMYWRGLKEPK